MFEKLEIMQMAQAMARQAALRQNVVAQNIANADTPGYRARDVASFAETYRSDLETPMKTTRPGHLGGANDYTVAAVETSGGDATSPDGNGVSLEDEMVKSVDVKRQHDLALTIYKSSLDILRTSLGKA